MSSKVLPQIPYGAVYFRKSNPPKEDWERDYKIAAEDGMNIFRHWFMWGAIEITPGVYDWEDYDRQMELGEKYGIKTIISEMITSVPEWVYKKYNHLLYEDADGKKAKSIMGGSSTSGGFAKGSAGGLCLDHEESRELAGKFLTELANRYKDSHSMLGYDIWNECNYSSDICFCSATEQKFREWLKKKYGSLKELNITWHRYSYSQWEDINIPVQSEPYPECLDWLEFKKENFYEQMQWRIDLIRSIDKKHLITAHGIAGSLNNMPAGGSDDWLAASKVEVYGLTWVASRKGNESWKQWHAVDLVRAGSKDKPFWHAEAQGGPLWLQPQVINRPKEDGRITFPEDIRLWNMISFAGGARGILYPRWRPLLDGPLFGAFGAYGMDGKRTSRSQMASKIAKWANEEGQKELFEASPVKGEIGILVIPETQTFNYCLFGKDSNDLYSKAMCGAYRGFFDNNIQADWVSIDDIEGYDVLYLPYPISMNGKTAKSIIKWVENGGTLISEGCAAYFGDHGKVGTEQPNFGFAQLFGAIQEDIEFMPDISGNVTFSIGDKIVRGGGFIQSYLAEEGKVIGRFMDGKAAVIENTYKSGKTLLIGTFPSEAYYRTNDQINKEFFSDILLWAGKKQKVKVSKSNVQVRLQESKTGRYLWILNSLQEDQIIDLEVSQDLDQVSIKKVFWGDVGSNFTQRSLKVNIHGRDVIILKI